MKKSEVEKIRDILLQVRSILELEKENEFTELSGRVRREIFDLVVQKIGKENLKFSGDGDRAYVSYDFNVGDFFFITSAGSNDIESNRENLIKMYVDYDQNSNLLVGIDSVIKKLDAIKDHRPPLALLNTSIITSDGSYSLRTISLDKAKDLVEDANGLDSAIGHESTAQILTELLGVDVNVNRQNFVQRTEQQALVFKLKGRPPEGTILTKEELMRIGYEFKLLERQK